MSYYKHGTGSPIRWINTYKATEQGALKEIEYWPNDEGDIGPTESTWLVWPLHPYGAVR